VRKVFKRALGKAKLPTFRLYDLRHTFASLLLAASAPITYVSAQLGHVNASTTLKYYARWIPNRGRRWVDLLDPRHGRGGVDGEGSVQWKVEPDRTEKRNRASRWSGSARFDWWAVKDSNLGPAD